MNGGSVLGAPRATLLPMDAPVCLITGASSGIGEALALEHARRGHHVVVLGRRLDKLEALAAKLSALGHGPGKKDKKEALALACDVSVDGQIEEAVRATLARFGRLDLAIANAGISIDGAFEQTTLAAQRQVMETNYFGILRTAYACFEPLRASKGGFAAVGSVSGFVCVPGFTAYTASKFAVRGFLGTLEVDREWTRAVAESMPELPDARVTRLVAELGLPPADAGQSVVIEFEGVRERAQVWINGHLLGQRPYGYTSVVYDLTPFLRFGDQDNILAVRAARRFPSILPMLARGEINLTTISILNRHLNAENHQGLLRLPQQRAAGILSAA